MFGYEIGKPFSRSKEKWTWFYRS